MGNVGVQQLGGRHRRLPLGKGNLVIGKVHRVFRPGQLQQIGFLGGKLAVRRLYSRRVQPAGEIEDMYAVIVGNGRGVAALTLRVKAPGIQVGGQLPLLHPAVAAAVQGGSFILRIEMR